MIILKYWCLCLFTVHLCPTRVDGFSAASSSPNNIQSWLASPSADVIPKISSITDASLILQQWDTWYNNESRTTMTTETSPNSETGTAERIRPILPESVRYLSVAAAEERMKDSTTGRCMLGICASSLDEGIMTLKAWVTSLQLPRGLLHGADQEGVQLRLDGGVYIKYNSGGVYTFADIRKSGMGFEALWKPGDAMMEPYDGSFRGVYFQVELSDGEFRQYLVPLDTFTLE